MNLKEKKNQVVFFVIYVDELLLDKLLHRYHFS